MEIIKTNIPGVLIIEPRVFKDSRGYFFESFSQREFDEKVTPILGHSIHFVQDNESMSSYGVMRGLHYQRMPYTQSKLVRCVKGAVLDVAVDIRKGSPTFGQHVSCLLTGRDEEGMKIAEQFAKESAIINQSSVISNQQSAFSFSSLVVLPMASPFSPRPLSSNTSATSSIIPRPMAASISRTNHLASIGAYLWRKRYSAKRT